jgi:hypothetical protein
MASGLRLVAGMGAQQDTHIRTGPHLRLLALGVLLTLATACSRQSGVLSLTQPARASHDLPFNQGVEESGFSPTQAFASSVMPIGTPIIVRLTSPLSSAETRTGETFEAVLDEPILVQGQIRVQRGASVLGRVAAAKPFEPPNHAGYLRLTLASIITNREALQVNTSSIFAKGSWRELSAASRPTNGVPAFNQSLLLNASQVAGAAKSGAGEVKFSTAQRLTFRLLGSLPAGR